LTEFVGFSLSILVAKSIRSARYANGLTAVMHSGQSHGGCSTAAVAAAAAEEVLLLAVVAVVAGAPTESAVIATVAL
jgi:hypothetical protein